MSSSIRLMCRVGAGGTVGVLCRTFVGRGRDIGRERSTQLPLKSSADRTQHTWRARAVGLCRVGAVHFDVFYRLYSPGGRLGSVGRSYYIAALKLSADRTLHTWCARAVEVCRAGAAFMRKLSFWHSDPYNIYIYIYNLNLLEVLTLKF